MHLNADFDKEITGYHIFKYYCELFLNIREIYFYEKGSLYFFG